MGTGTDHLSSGEDHFDSGVTVIAISADNTWMHIFPNVKAMLETLDARRASLGPIDFFDGHGCQLAPVFGEAWTLERLQATPGRPNQASVCKRISAVIRHLRDSIDQRFATLVDPPFTHEQALAQLPDLRGKDLAGCIAALQGVFADGAGQSDENRISDDGSFWHNLLCHCC